MNHKREPDRDATSPLAPDMSPAPGAPSIGSQTPVDATPNFSESPAPTPPSASGQSPGPGTSPADDHARVGSGAASPFGDVPMPLDDPMPTRIGGYRIVRELGRGGMGTVYEAEQESTRRFVAVKVIHPHLATARYRRRFAEEVRTLGRFEHPGIAHIHDAGSAPDDQGALRLFFAMELVAGLQLDQHANSRSMTPRAIAELVALVADAVHHAHTKGVIHCDLKPANVLVGADGVPKVLDFGIARIMGDEAHELTAATHPFGHAAVIGTLAYASPEQVAGDRNAIDVLTDVYGLGAVLYSVLAGRPPHDLHGCGLADAARLVREREPDRLRAHRPSCPLDLECIVAKAMAPRKEDRYESAAALAADLRRFIAGRPTVARPAPWYEVAAKWVGRHRTATAVMSVLGIVLVASIALVTSANLQRLAEVQHRLAEQADHARSLRAIRASQLDADARFLASTVFIERLRADELPAYGGRVLASMNWPPASPSGRSGSSMQALDDDGEIIDSLDGPRAWPAWARPRFDPNAIFEASIDVPRPAKTLVALLGARDPGQPRLLVRGLQLLHEHLHMALLEIDELTTVLNAGGDPTSTTTQIWSHGDFRHVAWDQSRHLLWVIAHSEDLAAYEPGLRGWDTAGCPIGLEVPRILIAIDLSRGLPASGVLPPLAGDEDHPSVPLAWALSLRAPMLKRSGDAARGVRTTGAPENDTLLQVHSFEPSLPEDESLGRLFVAIREPNRSNDSILSVEIGADGRPRGDFRPEWSDIPAMDELARATAPRLEPADVIVSLRLDSIEEPIAEAESLLATHGSRDAALDALRASVDDEAQRARIASCIDAMTTNWRWLLASSGELLRADGTIHRLGDAPDDATAWRARIALERVDDAGRLHADRCPRHGDQLAADDRASCICDWFIECRRALALAVAAEWDACLDATARAIEIHGDHAGLGPFDVVDFALRAVALQRLGRFDEARDALADAESNTESAVTGPMHQGGIDMLAAALVARARIIVGDQ